MKRQIWGVVFGVMFFIFTNLFLLLVQGLAIVLENLNMMWAVWLVGLLLSGFITGYIAKSKGGICGAITGIMSYVIVCIIILVYLYVSNMNIDAPSGELIRSLSKFSSYMFVAVLPVVIVGSIVTSMGGFFGEVLAKSKKHK